jgi:hypothetical protein
MVSFATINSAKTSRSFSLSLFPELNKPCFRALAMFLLGNSRAGRIFSAGDAGPLSLEKPHATIG